MKAAVPDSCSQQLQRTHLLNNSSAPDQKIRISHHQALPVPEVQYTDRYYFRRSHLLSNLTHFAGVVIAPRRPSSRIRQIEFLSLSEKRILLIIVTADGDVQNRIVTTDKAYSPAELVSAANYLTHNFAGLDFEHFFLQPMDNPQRLANTEAAVNYCMAHPQWRLSLQTHKYIGIP